MVTYPLYSNTEEQAKQLQFKIVDAATRRFTGAQALDLGDLGVVRGTNKPLQTMRVEQVFADTFDAEAACLVRGAGTGALRWALAAALCPGDTLLIHTAPIYPTTGVTVRTMGLNTVQADFNSDAELRRAFAEHAEIRGVLIQHSRQQPDDRYDFCHVIALCRELRPGAAIVTDDNYAALKVPKIGCQAGADLASFSCFKILGPEGIGVVLGKKAMVDAVYGMQYSGGSQVQGHEAMAALRGLIYAPVALAITAETCEETVRRLNAGAVPHVKSACVANSESKAVIVELDADLAEAVLGAAPALGAAPHPVGCESRYEFVPMFYRISGTFRAKDPAWEKRMIRINVMRAGPDTVLRILAQAIARAQEPG